MAILEICTNSIRSAVNAEAGGADRVELCQNLEAGGITPSIGLISAVKQKLTVPIHVLIRPRTGDFVYDDDEFEVMLKDIEACCGLNCEGIAVGVLMPDTRVDVPRLQKLVQKAAPMTVTFHRAFDDCHDPFQALEDIIRAGCSRVLTSGGAESALAGSSTIAQLVHQAKDRIIVMPGGGIAASNLKTLAQLTTATEYHASAKTTHDHTTTSRFAAVQIYTDLEKVKALVDLLA